MTHNRRSLRLFRVLFSFVVALTVSLGLVLSFSGDLAVAADKKPPKKSTKSSGKGLDDLKTSDVEVKASEGDTATAIRGKPGRPDGDQRGDQSPPSDTEQETVSPAPKK